MKVFYAAVLLFVTIQVSAQQIKVEFDKGRDFSRYRTFRFGEGQITTPRDQRTLPDSTIHRWIKSAILEELTEKGLKPSDSADIVVSYLTGVEQRSDMGSVGPLGMTPGSTSQTYLRDYQQGNLVIDLNDSHNNQLIWRVSAVTQSGQGEGDKIIDEVVEKGFRKLSLKPKKK